MISDTTARVGRFGCDQDYPMFGKVLSHRQIQTAEHYTHMPRKTVQEPATRLSHGNESDTLL